MKRFVFFAIFALFSTSFAESYRLLDTPRCIIDLDASKNVVNVSKCPVFHDQFYGDSTFSAGILCHDMESLNGENSVHVVPKSLIEKKDGSRESYFEITARTKYSFRVDFIVKFAGKEPLVFPAETFFEWLKTGRIDSCVFELASPHNVKLISK